MPREIAVAQLVPGDVVRLAAGNMIPGVVRIIQAKDLFVIQGSLTGESFPVEKLEVEKKTGVNRRCMMFFSFSGGNSFSAVDCQQTTRRSGFIP